MQTIESLVVGAIVIFCAGFSVWRLLSVRLRLRVLEALPTSAESAAHGWKARARAKLLQQLSPGCTTCASGPKSLSQVSRDETRRFAAPRR
jgi:hypothetical protein